MLKNLCVQKYFDFENQLTKSVKIIKLAYVMQIYAVSQNTMLITVTLQSVVKIKIKNSSRNLKISTIGKNTDWSF